MRRSHYILLLGAILLCTIGCSKLRGVPASASIEYERTPCFGGCPIYTLKVSGSGEAEFTGKRFTKKIGTYTKQLSKEDTRALFKRLNEEDWDSYKDHYPTKSTDLPSTIFRYNYKKISKEVVVSGEHPASLDVLSDKLARIAESDGWTSTSE